MCGLPFAGKSVLAGALSRELRIRLLSYDFEIYQVHGRRAPANSSPTAKYAFVQDIARREIGAILASGESLIYDDLLLGREDRRKLAAVAEARWAELVLEIGRASCRGGVYLREGRGWAAGEEASADGR